MNDIKAMFEIDFQSVMLALVTFMLGFIALRKACTEALGWLGLETKFMRDRRVQKEDIEYLKQHSGEQDQKIDNITNAINKLGNQVEELATKVEECHKKNAEAERSKLGDRLTQSFRYYNEKKCMTSMEKWAFDNLVKAYGDMGGDGYIDEVVVPASLTWKIVDE